MENKDFKPKSIANAPIGRAATPMAQSPIQKAYKPTLKVRINRAWQKFKVWARTLNIADIAHLAMLVLIITTLIILIKVAQQNNRIANRIMPEYTATRAGSQGSYSAPKRVVSTRVPAAVALDTKTGMASIVLPMKSVIRQAAPQIQPRNTSQFRAISNNDWIRAEAAYRSSTRVRGIKPMSVVNGNLYIQNMRSYTLPCGTRVRGHIFVRNVRSLKFCGCFEVSGNIYVANGVAFGPIPRAARIGGQVIY
ncbi:MAG: hypothetical protein LBB23_02995 [Rickettsiales bacterium]|jgi:hypothetical protein|nr:hypothetical protein [Rickettsiales bacterium]